MLTEFFSDRLVPHVVEQRARPNEGIRRCTRYFLTSSICFGLVFGAAAASIAVFAIPGSTPRRILFTALTVGAFIGLSRGLTLGGLSALRHLSTAPEQLLAPDSTSRTMRGVPPWPMTGTSARPENLTLGRQCQDGIEGHVHPG
jgi:hypothetical protein